MWDMANNKIIFLLLNEWMVQKYHNFSGCCGWIWIVLIWWEFKTKIISVIGLGTFFNRKIISKHQSKSAIIYVTEKKRSSRSIFKYKHSPLAAAADQSQTIIASYTFTKMFIVFINKFSSCHRKAFLQIFSMNFSLLILSIILCTQLIIRILWSHSTIPKITLDSKRWRKIMSGKTNSCQRLNPERSLWNNKYEEKKILFRENEAWWQLRCLWWTL